VEDALDPALTPARPVAATEAADGESALVAASRKGSARAFNELVLRWEGPVYNLSLRMLGDPEEAAEATQETFLSAYRGLSRFRGRSRFSTWLYRIASNRCLTRLRQRPDVAGLSLDAGPVGRAGALLAGDPPEAELLQRERRLRVRRALATLAPDQRIVVELKVYRDRTFDQIAEILDLPASTVKTRFYAGLQLLERKLAPIKRQP